MTNFVISVNQDFLFDLTLIVCIKFLFNFTLPALTYLMRVPATYSGPAQLTLVISLSFISQEKQQYRDTIVLKSASASSQPRVSIRQKQICTITNHPLNPVGILQNQSYNDKKLFSIYEFKLCLIQTHAVQAIRPIHETHLRNILF